jgi:hypothetical protein
MATELAQKNMSRSSICHGPGRINEKHVIEVAIDMFQSRIVSWAERGQKNIILGYWRSYSAAAWTPHFAVLLLTLFLEN